MTVTNDGKEKYQSCEAFIELYDSGSMSNYAVQITGYGATEEEARKTLKEQAEALINRLKEF